MAPAGTVAAGIRAWSSLHLHYLPRCTCAWRCLYRRVILVLRMAVHGLCDLYLKTCHSSSFRPQPLIVIFWLLQESEVWFVFDEAVNNLKWSSSAHSALNVSVCCCRSTSSRKNRASHRLNTRLRHGRALKLIDVFIDWWFHSSILRPLVLVVTTVSAGSGAFISSRDDPDNNTVIMGLVCESKMVIHNRREARLLRSLHVEYFSFNSNWVIVKHNNDCFSEISYCFLSPFTASLDGRVRGHTGPTSTFDGRAQHSSDKMQEFHVGPIEGAASKYMYLTGNCTRRDDNVWTARE